MITTHEHAHDHAHHADMNIRAAYVHVLADAATSVLAIVALVGGLFWGLGWLDPVMGLVGAALVSVWAWGLLRDSGRILLDAEMDAPVVAEVREVIEQGEVPAKITDLHVWRVGRAKYAVVVSVATSSQGRRILPARAVCARGARACHRRGDRAEPAPILSAGTGSSRRRTRVRPLPGLAAVSADCTCRAVRWGASSAGSRTCSRAAARRAATRPRGMHGKQVRGVAHLQILVLGSLDRDVRDDADAETFTHVFLDHVGVPRVSATLGVRPCSANSSSNDAGPVKLNE